MKELKSNMIEFRSVEEPQIADIHKHQNGESREELSHFLDFEFPWAPMSFGQVKARIEEMQKEEHAALFCIHSRGGEFIGLVMYGASWDSWEPYFGLVLWPEHRRKGHGSETVKAVLDESFKSGIAHVVGCRIPDWNTGGQAFLKALGFKNGGVRRRSGIKDGKFYDDMFFDILRDEYLSQSAKGDEG